MMLLSTCSECEGGRSARREEKGQVRGEMTEVQHLKRERGRGGMRRAKGGNAHCFPYMFNFVRMVGECMGGVWISEDE